MSITTRAELFTALANRSKRTDRTDYMADYLAYAHQEICRTLRCTVMEDTSDLTLSAERIAVPTRFRALKRAYIDLTPRIVLNATSSEHRADMTGQYGTGTYPSHVAVEGAYLAFAPLFSSTTATLKVLFYKEPAALTAASDTNVVLAKYPMLYLYGCLAELFRDIEDDNLAGKYEGLFRAMIADINLSENRDANSGPLVVTPYAGSVV